MTRAVLLLAAGVSWAQSPFEAVPAAQEDALRFGAKLPAFEVKDIDGRTWTLEDLRGKYTLLYVWHTFAARWSDRFQPGTREILHGLPDLREVEQVYQEAKKSGGIQALTFCTDYDYTHAPEYLKETPYSFPVIADWTLIRKLVPEASGHGTHWVVSPGGRLSQPFRSWSFTRVLWEVRRLAALPVPVDQHADAVGDGDHGADLRSVDRWAHDVDDRVHGDEEGDETPEQPHPGGGFQPHW